jgi:Fe2+ or Zn2+ uptake regulation protein
MPAVRPGVRQRKTWQRGAVLAAVGAAPCHLTAEDVYRRLRRGSRSIGLATVYRALDAFVREGLIEPAHVGDGKVRYGLAARHHDHLVCLGCGAWQPLDRCPVPPPSRPGVAGFEIVGHHLEMFGYCDKCRRTRPGGSAPIRAATRARPRTRAHA